MAPRVLLCFLALGCYQSHPRVDGPDTGRMDAATRDAPACAVPIDWHIEEPLVAFTNAFPTADGWRIFGTADSTDLPSAWLIGQGGDLSPRQELLERRWFSYGRWGIATEQLAATSSAHRIQVGRFSESGDAVWRTEYEHERDLQAYQVIDAGSAVYVMGTASTPAALTFIARFDDEGRLDWAQEFGSPVGVGGTQRPIRSFLDADGRLIVATQIRHGAGGPVWIFALTPDGEVAWEYLHTESFERASEWALVPTDDGLLIAGTIEGPIGSTGPGQAILLGADGELIATTAIDDGTGQQHILSDGTRTRDGGFLLAGWTSSDQSGHVWKLSAAGELLWTRAPEAVGSGFDHIAPFDGGYILAANPGFGDERTWVFVGVSDTGEALWRHDMEVPSRNYVMDLVPSPTGEVLAIGFSIDEDDVRVATALQFGQRCR